MYTSRSVSSDEDNGGVGTSQNAEAANFHKDPMTCMRYAEEYEVKNQGRIPWRWNTDDVLPCCPSVYLVISGRQL